jgi:hypothetical protein
MHSMPVCSMHSCHVKASGSTEKRAKNAAAPGMNADYLGRRLAHFRSTLQAISPSDEFTFDTSNRPHFPPPFTAFPTVSPWHPQLWRMPSSLVPCSSGLVRHWHRCPWNRSSTFLPSTLTGSCSRASRSGSRARTRFIPDALHQPWQPFKSKPEQLLTKSRLKLSS